MSSKNNKDKREPEYPVELESQFILRLPEEPAKHLKEALKTGDGLKNRLTIQIQNDMRHGEVKFDQWMMHAKIVDLPTIIESLKTIDNKSFYKTSDICQMMICKEEPEQTPQEEETPTKNKKKDPYKVDKKFLWLHGITPPTKNVRKRRFRKTLKKKYVEAPEIEKEVKRLLRADNEAESFTWEIVDESDDQPSRPETVVNPPAPSKPGKKSKQDRGKKGQDRAHKAKPEQSKVVDIFGGAVSDSDLEEDNINVENIEGESSRMTVYGSHSTHSNAGQSIDKKMDSLQAQFETQMFPSKHKSFGSHSRSEAQSMSSLISAGPSSEDDGDYHSRDSRGDMTARAEQLRMELDELKQRRQRTKQEIAGMENLALRQRFQDTLHTLNQDIMYKEMEYQGILTLQNSEDI